jgi:putative membrane protein
MKSSTHYLASRQTRFWTAAITSALLGTASLSAQAGSGGSSATRTTPATTSAADKLDRSDRKFIEKAAECNHKEMALSELAAQRATNQQVRSFAQQIVTDHTKANQQLMQLAQAKGVTLDDMGSMHSSTTGASTRTTPASSTGTGATRSGGTTTAGTTTGTTGTTGAGAGTAGTAGSPNRMASMDDGDVKKLSSASGRDFDERYVKLMVKEHETAVKLFEEAAKDAKDPEVRSYASQHVGSLRQHLQQAKNLERSVAE